MIITGILSISNASGLNYPYPVVVHSLSRMCDNVIVGVDPTFPTDRRTIDIFDLENVTLVDSVWNRENRNGGTEIALQMDKLVSLAAEQGSDWVVVVQADELFHDDDFSMLRLFMKRNINTNVIGFSTERLYFWRDLNTIRTDWNANLVRVFKPNHYSFLADGTSKDGMYSGKILDGEEVALPYKLYHYSRVDPDPKYISLRVRNLDSFFHPEESLIPLEELPDYDFSTREHDNFSRHGFPPTKKGNFCVFLNSHPPGITEWYKCLD